MGIILALNFAFLDKNFFDKKKLLDSILTA